MSEPGTYTALDIERYHRGEMPPAEMHLLEKAALDDPILADMLEGYRFSQTASADLQLLQNRLQQRLENKRNIARVVGLQWLKIAAILLVVAGAGWLVLQTFSTERNSFANRKIAARKNSNPVSTDSSLTPMRATSPARKTDSLSTLNDVAVNEPKSRKRQMPTYEQVHPAAPVSAATEPVAEKDAGSASNDLRLMKAGEVKSDSAPAIAILSGRTAGVETSTPNDSTRNLHIVLKPQDQSLSEVVVTSAKPKMKRSNKPSVVIDTLEPEQGWQSFDDYIAENLKAPEEMKEKRVSENEVELSFHIDQEGNPVEIKITKSLCSKCDAEAIRLLKDGPKWKGKKGKVKIKFPPVP